MRDTAQAVLNGTQVSLNELAPDVVQDRIKQLVAQIKHAQKIKATVRLERSKNELRSIVRMYGIGVMSDVYREYGFTRTVILEDSKPH